MPNLSSKTSPSSHIFSIPSNFLNYRWGTETGAFPWPSCYCFCKKWSNFNISSYYFKHKSLKSLSSKKMSDGQSDIHTTIKYIFLFQQILIRSEKNWSNTLKLKFILMFFDSVYPSRPSDTVTKYTIYPLILLVERLFKWSWVLFCYFIVWLAKPDSKMPCILLFGIEYSLEFVSTNPSFLSRPSDTKIQTAIIWC